MIVDAWDVKALGATGVQIGLRSLYAKDLCITISSVLEQGRGDYLCGFGMLPLKTDKRCESFARS